MRICCWCKKDHPEARYPNVAAFDLYYEHGTDSDLFGPSLEGYEVEDLCHTCALKLKDALIELGINVTAKDI